MGEIGDPEISDHQENAERGRSCLYALSLSNHDLPTMRLEMDLWINGDGPKRASGTCHRTMLESIGEDPVCFREQNKLITHFVWIRCHDGLKHVQIPPEKPKGKKLGSKTVSKLEKRIAAWTK